MNNNTNLSLEDALKKYGNNGGTSFFNLQNNGDSAVVRFLYGDNPNELDWFIVYKIKIGDKERYVKQNSDNDALARSGYKPMLRAMIQLVKEGTEEVLIWDRGKNHIEQLIVFMNQNGALNKIPYSITRQGNRGSKDTKYFISPVVSAINSAVPNLPERKKIVDGHKGFVLELTEEEMIQAAQGTLNLNTNQTSTNIMNAYSQHVQPQTTQFNVNPNIVMPTTPTQTNNTNSPAKMF